MTSSFFLIFLICRAVLLRFLWTSQHSVLVFPANLLLENSKKCKTNKSFKTASGSETGPNHVLHGLQLSCSRTDEAENLLSPLNPAKKKTTTNVLQMSCMCKALPLFMCHMFVHSGNGFPIADLSSPGHKQTLIGRPTASKMT